MLHKTILGGVAAVMIAALAGCGHSQSDRALGGAALGAAGGAAAGALFGSPGTGAVLGGAAGAAGGAFTDDDDINLGDPIWK